MRNKSKINKPSMDSYDDSFDDVLANMEMPQNPKSSEPPKASTNSASTATKSALTTISTPEPTSLATALPKSAPPSSILKPATEEKSKYPNAIQVNPKQRGNPILKSITNIPWEFNDKIIPDYVVGKAACVLFLSIRYHNLKPDYIHERLKQLGKNYELRVLLVQVDIKESQNALKHLTRICLLADLTLMLAWTPEEAGKIIETYKLFENRSPDFIMEKSETDNYQKVKEVKANREIVFNIFYFLNQVVNALTSIKSVNKTDAMTLLTNFGTLGNLIQASENKLNACPGLGVKKAQKLVKVFNESFLK